MKISLTRHDGYALAKTEGTIDETAKDCFDEHLHPIIESPGQRLLIDLAGSQRITSAGIGHLVTLVSRANAKGSHVVLTQPTSFVNSIFDATKITKFLDVEPSLEKAVNRLTGRSADE